MNGQQAVKALRKAGYTIEKDPEGHMLVLHPQTGERLVRLPIPGTGANKNMGGVYLATVRKLLQRRVS